MSNEHVWKERPPPLATLRQLRSGKYLSPRRYWLECQWVNLGRHMWSGPPSPDIVSWPKGISVAEGCRLMGLARSTF